MATPPFHRLPRLALATCAFLVVSLNSPPSSPNIDTTQPPPPSAAEVEALVELHEWILGGPADGRFHAFEGMSLATAVETHDRGFELFRRYHGAGAGLAQVRRLPFGELIARCAAAHGLDPLLVAAVAEAESSFNANAVSVAGALGLMQITPETVQLYGGGDPFDPAVNVDVGVRLLRDLLQTFDGSVPLALAAYNAGPGAVERFGGLPPYGETRGFVDRVLALYVEHHRAIWERSPDRGWLF